MFSLPKVTNEIMALVTSFVSILHGKSEKKKSISFHQQKYYQICEGSHYIEIVDTYCQYHQNEVPSCFVKWCFSEKKKKK